MIRRMNMNNYDVYCTFYEKNTFNYMTKLIMIFNTVFVLSGPQTNKTKQLMRPLYIKTIFVIQTLFLTVLILYKNFNFKPIFVLK